MEGQDLMMKIRTLFDTTQSFILEVKLINNDIWLNLNAGLMNDHSAIIVATDILFKNTHIVLVLIIVI